MSFRHLRNAHGFFSDYYLGSVFARRSVRGRQAKIPDRAANVAYVRFRRLWERVEGKVHDAPACRERFLRPLLRDILGFHLGAGENRLHLLYASAEDEQAGNKALLAVYCGEWNEDLDAGRGRTNPMRQVEEALSRFSLGYGMVLTGERARLVRAPGEGPRGAYLEADLTGLAEDEDPESFEAFLKLFSVTNFLPPGSNGKLPIEEIEQESRQHAERVSEDLQRAVFAAAESLVSGLIADAVARGEISSPLELDESRLLEYRDAALLALYRTLFILYAESRDPRLAENQVYWKSYSAHGLVDEIMRDPDRDWPDNRSYMWERLLSLFHIYDEGLPAISPWDYIPPRGSDFFSPTTRAGQILELARLSDRRVAQLLLDLATTTPRRGIGRERVSFRELDIEQLGAVYEGLLERAPRIVRELSIVLRVQGRELVLTPSEVARLCEAKNLTLRGDFGVVKETTAERFHPEASQTRSKDEDEEAEAEEYDEDTGEEDESDLENEGGEVEEEGEEEIKKGSATRLIARLEPGTFHFVPSSARKGSGSFYTPRPLAKDLVRHTLGPLVEGKTAAEIERLRVLDPACGSAHFLVEAMRFLGQALHRAYVEEYNGRKPPEFRSTTGQGWDDNWRATDEEARASGSEARAWCKRRIAERCLFGVDLNPMAVQLACVALWIESVAGDRPLTFFEHHIRCGNSLLGSWMAKLEVPPVPQKGLRSNSRQTALGFQELVRQKILEAARLRKIIDEVRHEDLEREGIDPESTREQNYKKYLHKKAEEIISTAKLVFDLRSASAFVPEIWDEWETVTRLLDKPQELEKYIKERPWFDRFEKVRSNERFFHWELEFPEVFLDEGRRGFDAVLGNPPWEKVLPSRHEFYGACDILIRAYTGTELDQRIRELEAANPQLKESFKEYRERTRTISLTLRKGGDYSFHDWVLGSSKTGGHQDFFKFFVERAWQLVRDGGRVGFVVPSAIYNDQGCTGLRHLLFEKARVERFYAFENRKKIFPIDSRQKFVSLVFQKSQPADGELEAAFMRHDLSELEATARYREPGQDKVKPFAAPWLVRVRKAELERISPGTLAFLEYRSPRDREILLKMYGYDVEGKPVNPRPLLGDQGPGTWNARFYTEFNMTNDRDLWTDRRTGKLYNPRQVLGPIAGTTDRPPYYDPRAWQEIRARMAEKGFWPLYEGKHIEQFLMDIRPIERWVSLEACEEKHDWSPGPGPKLVIRAIASNTNERTCIAAVLPEHSCFAHSLYGCSSSVDINLVASAMNTLAFDFALRSRVSANVSPIYLKLPPIPSIAPASYGIIETESVAGTGIVNVSSVKEKWPTLWQVNRIVAEAYGLRPDEFQYILSTFPVFCRKRPDFWHYLLERVSEWKREQQHVSATRVAEGDHVCGTKV